MWDVVEAEMGVKIPKYLQNLTNFCGFDQPLTLAKMTDEHIAYMEMFARNKMRVLISAEENLEEYYDKFHIVPHIFEIVMGHKILLKEVQYFVAVKLATDRQYFNVGKQDYEKRLNTSTSDIEAKEEELYNGVKSWLKRQVMIDPQIVESFTPKSIFVEIVAGNITGRMECPICQSIYKAHYEHYGNKMKKRWIRANFEKHVKSHFTDVANTSNLLASNQEGVKEEFKVEIVAHEPSISFYHMD